jgi:hypothetical protein
MVFSSLASKLVATVFSNLASKPVATVSPDFASKSVMGFLVEPQNHGGGGFPGLVLKTKRAMVCRLRYKIDRRVMRWDTRRDLVACFTWKQVRLEFSSLTSRLVEARRRVVHVAPSRRLRRDQVEDRRVASTLVLSFLFYYALGAL